MKPKKRRRNRFPSLLSASLVSFLLASQAGALQITFSSADPEPDEHDVFQFTGAANDAANVRDSGEYADGAANDGFTYVAIDRFAQGQTFTTGSHPEGYALSSIWVRQAGYSENTVNTYWNLTGGGSPLTFRITRPSLAGSEEFSLVSKTYTFTGDEPGGPTPRNGSGLQGAGIWLKLTLAEPVVLLPDTQYGFDLNFFDGSNRFLELLGTEDTGVYAGGGAYQGATAEASDNTLQPLIGHRVFLADLTPLAPLPVITEQPGDFVGFVGDNLEIISGAVADPAPSLQWQHSLDGVSGWTDMPGADQPIFTIFHVLYSERGFYRLVATNDNGSVESDPAEVILSYPPPVIFQQPVSIAAEIGETVSFSVFASGLGNLTYQWFKNGEPLDGEDLDTLVLTDVGPEDEGDYSVEITDDAGIADGQGTTSILSDIVTFEIFGRWDGLMSHDPFDIAAGYVEGLLPDQNPPIVGYSGPWTWVDFGTAGPSVSAGSLVYPNPFYLGSSGDKIAIPADSTGGEIVAANSGRVFRLLEGALKVTEQTAGTRYLSFLFQSGQETGPTVYQALHLNDGNGDGNRKFDLGLTTNGGLSGSEYGFGAQGIYTSTGVAATTGVRLFVVKFELSEEFGEDTVTVWVDPPLGGGEPQGGITVDNVDLTWDRLSLSDYDGNSAAWDEIRWGSTFDSVTLNPDPPQGDTFAGWILGFTGLDGKIDFDDDPDGDGLKNGLEYYFGTHPGEPSGGLAAISAGGDTLTFRHPRNTEGVGGLSAAYLWSTDLVNFHESGAASGGTTVVLAAAPGSPSIETTTVTATIDGVKPPKLFVVLRVENSP